MGLSVKMYGPVDEGVSHLFWGHNPPLSYVLPSQLLAVRSFFRERSALASKGRAGGCIAFFRAHVFGILHGALLLARSVSRRGAPCRLCIMILFFFLGFSSRAGCVSHIRVFFRN